jgi:hypothetical protein
LFEEKKALETVGDRSAQAAGANIDDVVDLDAAASASVGNPKVQKDDNPLKQELRKFIARDKVDMWAEMVERSYRAHVTLLVEPASATELKEKLVESDAFKMRGISGTSYTGAEFVVCRSTYGVTEKVREMHHCLASHLQLRLQMQLTQCACSAAAATAANHAAAVAIAASHVLRC